MTLIQAALYRDYVCKAEAASIEPLDEANFRKACQSMASGTSVRSGALDPVAVNTTLNIKRSGGYCDEIASRFPQLNVHCEKLKAQFELTEKLIRRTVHQHMSDTAEVAEFDFQHAFADPTGADPSRPTVRDATHPYRDPELATIAKLPLEYKELLAVAKAAWLAERAATPPTPPAAAADADADAAVAAAAAPTAAPAAATPVAAAPEVAAALSDPRTARMLAEWLQLFEYAFQRIRQGYAHQVQAANEAGVPRELIRELVYGEATATCDWKSKWLSAVFREAQSDFFGKTGIPWHGTMFYFLAEEGSPFIDIEYIDAVMAADGKEDGTATFGAFELSVQKFKEAHPHVTKLKAVRSDGAVAYAGVEFAMGLALMTASNGLPVEKHHIGTSGNNKSSLDAHFASAGQAVGRLIDGGHHDADSERALAQAISACGIAKTMVVLFTADRSFKLDIGAIPNLTKMSKREFEKDPENDNRTCSIRMWQQTRWGVGAVVKLDSLLIDEDHCAMPSATQREFGSSSTAAGAAAGTGTARGPERARGAAQRNGGIELRQGALSKKNLTLTKAAIAARQTERQQRRLAGLQQAQALKRSRREETGGGRGRGASMLWCAYQPDGCAGCAYHCVSRKWMARHIAAGAIDPTCHRTRQRGGHAVGTIVNSGARIAHAAAAMMANATAAAAPMQPQGQGLSTTVDAAGFTVTLLSGRSVALPAPVAGWARHSRLPVTSATSAMYLFAEWAAGLKSQGKQLKNQEAMLEMRRAGTADFTADWPSDPYATSIRTATGAPYFSRMHLFEHAALKALLTKGAAYCKAQAAKALAREQKAVTAAQKAVTAAAKKRTQQTPGGGGAAGCAAAPPAKRPRAYESGHLVDASAVTALDSRLDALPGKAVHGIGVDMLVHYAKPQGWPTCAALAAMADNQPAIEARPRTPVAHPSPTQAPVRVRVRAVHNPCSSPNPNPNPN